MVILKFSNLNQSLTFILIEKYLEDLNDVICTKNDSDDVAKVDDVTIEKVTLSKEELDRSLFEYELFKNSSKELKKKDTRNDSIIISTDSKRLNEISKSNIFRDIEDSFNSFIQDNENCQIENLDINKIQNEYKKLSNGNISQITIEQFDENRSILHRDIEQTTKKNDTNEEQLEKTKVYDLKELYKWETVSGKLTADKVTSKEDTTYVESKEKETYRDHIYAFYYQYYFKYLSNKFINE